MRPMLTTLSAYIRRRVIARIGIAVAAAAVGLLFLGGIEALFGYRERPRAFLYEPFGVPTVHDLDFIVQVPATELGKDLTAGDFSIEGSRSTNLTFDAVDAKYVDSPAAITKKGGSSASVALLADQSGSIHFTDPSNLRIAAAKAFANAVPPDTRLGIFSFGQSDEISPADRPRAPFGASISAVRQAIDDLKDRESGLTPTFAALKSVLDQMVNEPSDRDKAILCFTDGEADDQQNAAQVVQQAQNERVQIWFVALGPTGDFTENAAVARATGGGLVNAQDASGLGSAFDHLAHAVVHPPMPAHYDVTIHAHKGGAVFTNGEVLTPTVGPRSRKIAPSKYRIPITQSEWSGIVL